MGSLHSTISKRQVYAAYTIRRIAMRSRLWPTLMLGAFGAVALSAPVPRFQVSMLWPKPMPERWIQGSTVGVAVDANDHVFVLNIADAFNARTEIGAAPPPGVAVTGEFCVGAPAV